MVPKPLPTKMSDGTNCVSLLKKLSDENPDKQAFVFIDKDWNKTVLTRKDVWKNSRKFAAILRRHGVEKKDIVCNTLVNSPERLCTQLGTIVAGAISMQGQTLLTDGADLIHILRVAKARAIIVDPAEANGPFSILQTIQYTDQQTGRVCYTDLPDLAIVIKVNVLQNGDQDASFERGLRMIENETDEYEEADIDERDIAMLFSTSGTTGFSKQVPHAHKTLIPASIGLARLQGIESDQSRYFTDRPLGWLGGWPGPYLISGATHVLTDLCKGLPEAIDRRILRMLNEEEVDCGILLPKDIEILVKLINSGEKLNRRLREVGVTGMPIRKRVLMALNVITDVINNGYGTSETGYVSILPLKPGTPFEDFCIGNALEGFEIKIVDTEYNDVPTGTIGQVLLRGPTVFDGYLNEPEKTEKAFTKDGYLQVGDSAYRGEDGQIYLLGRVVDAVHRGYYLHYPGWIESRILKCPGVAHVSVVGVPDLVVCEEMCACIIPIEKDTLTECYLEEYCRALFIDAKAEVSAMPKYFIFFESFPFKENEKLDRKKMREMACERLNIKL